jgi:peptidoglycan/LPS O-acetylase OafA/YrhL
MRGLAALVVLYAHDRSFFFEPRSANAHGILSLIYLDYYFSSAAVLVFFVLSGYLVGTSVLKANRRGDWSWKNYLLSRGTRLYVVLIPSLIFTLLFDQIGRHSPATANYYLTTPGVGSDTARSFLGSLTFVQTILTDVFGTEAPLWSLANEFWYYILFPLAVLTLRRRLSSIAYGVAFVAIALFVRWDILSLFPTWLLGVLVGYLATKYPLPSAAYRRGLFLAGLVVFTASMVLEMLHRLAILPAKYGFAVGAGMMIWAALCSPRPSAQYAKVAVFFSEISYTLYLTHVPLLVLLAAIWQHKHQPWTPTVAHIVLQIVPLAFAVGFAYVAYLLFESRTESVRRFFHARLFPGPL